MERTLGGEENGLALRCLYGFLFRDRPIFCNHCSVVAYDDFRVFGREHSAVVAADDLRFEFAGDAAGFAVEQQVVAVAILGENGVSRRVGDRVQ